MVSESSATVFLKRAGMVLGAATGLTVLAFCAGFLARRAQFAIADIPFVFVDYWAYAETGFLGLVQTTYLVLESPWPILVMALLTIAIFLALELETFRRMVLRPHVAFLGSVVVVLIGAILVRQQLAVLRVADFSAPAELTVSKGHGDHALRTMAPFSWLVAKQLELPPELPTNFPQDSMDAWDVMANELDLRASRAPSAMEVRPLRGWVSVISKEDSMEKSAAALEKDASAQGRTLIGLSAPVEQLEASRARQLYRLLALWGLLSVWGVLLLHLWLRRVRSEMTLAATDVPTSRFRKVLIRLREEIWFSSWYVTRPLALGIAITSFCFLLPECYGALALPHIGEERVEVVVRKADDKQAGEGINSQHSDPIEHGTRNGRLNRTDERARLMSLVVEADGYHFADIDKRRTIEDAWVEKIGDYAAEANEDAERFLRKVSIATRQSAPQLSAIAHDAWIRVSSEIGTSRVGHILHYPRSEGEYLRLLTRFDASSGSRWTILPIKTEDILEVRVQESHEDSALAFTLRQMRSLDAEGRNQAIIEIELLGHPNVLEVMLAGIFDRSPIVQGPAITAVGRYAASMPDTAIGELRRRRAAEILLRVVEDSTKPARFRGTASTALHVFADGDCENAAKRLLYVLCDPKTAEHDRDWEIRGTIITSLAKMHHAPAVECLLAILKGDLGDCFLPPPPESVLISIPSALRSIGEPQLSVPTLAEMLNSPTTRAVLLGPIIAALGGLGSRGVDDSASAVVKFLQAPKRADVSEEKTIDNHQAAMLTLRLIGDPSAVPAIHQVVLTGTSIAGDIAYPADVQTTGVYALMSIDDPSSEGVLLTIAKDGSNRADLRSVSALALGRFDGGEATEELRDIAKEQASVARVELETLNELANEVPDLRLEVQMSLNDYMAKREYQGMWQVAEPQKKALDATVLFEAALSALKSRGDQGSGRAMSYYDSIKDLHPRNAFAAKLPGGWLGELQMLREVLRNYGDQG